MLDQQHDQHVEDFETMETQYSTNVHNVVSMLASLMRHQMKDYHHHLYAFLSDYILIFCMHLFGDTKDVFFIVFNTSKPLLFCISLSGVDGMSCFKFCIQYLSLLPPAFHNFHNLLFSDISLLTFSFHHHVCFLRMSSLICRVIHFTRKSFGTNFLKQSSLFTILASQKSSLCWVTHSSFGMTFTSRTNLIFCRLTKM